MEKNVLFFSYMTFLQLPTSATQGTVTEKRIRKENTISNDLLVDVMVKAIR